MLQAALNGGRDSAEHPALPVTPPQLARAAASAVRAGAAEIHLHARSEAGLESIEPEVVAQTLSLVRAACPAGTPIGLSTAFAIMGDVAVRYRCVAAWTALPDYVSLNMHEAGAAELMRLLLERGVGVEAGVWSPTAAEVLAGSGLAGSCLRVLIEAQEDSLEDALRNAEAIEQRLDALAIRLPRLLHGLDAPAWPLLARAVARGYDTRAGMEDMLYLPDGSLAPDNKTIIGAAVGVINAADASMRGQSTIHE